MLAWFASWPDELKVLLVVLVFLFALGQSSATELFFRVRRWFIRGA